MSAPLVVGLGGDAVALHVDDGDGEGGGAGEPADGALGGINFENEQPREKDAREVKITIAEDQVFEVPRVGAGPIHAGGHHQQEGDDELGAEGAARVRAERPSEQGNDRDEAEEAEEQWREVAGEVIAEDGPDEEVLADDLAEPCGVEGRENKAGARAENEVGLNGGTGAR